jgi:tight adherence protein B
MQSVVAQTKPPLADELAEVLKQVQLGTPMHVALVNMTRRVESRDLRIVVTAINLARETGGNLGEILLRLADTMKERKRIQGKIVSLTAQGKASGLVMSAVPFLLLIVLYAMEPQMVGLMFTTLLGNVMLCAVVVMVLLGSVLVKKIVQIDI